MTKINIQEIVENLLDTFLYAGKVSLELRDQGLTKEITIIKVNFRLWIWGRTVCWIFTKKEYSCSHI